MARRQRTPEELAPRLSVSLPKSVRQYLREKLGQQDEEGRLLMTESHVAEALINKAMRLERDELTTLEVIEVVLNHVDDDLISIATVMNALKKRAIEASEGYPLPLGIQMPHE